MFNIRPDDVPARGLDFAHGFKSFACYLEPATHSPRRHTIESDRKGKGCTGIEPVYDVSVICHRDTSASISPFPFLSPSYIGYYATFYNATMSHHATCGKLDNVALHIF